KRQKKMKRKKEVENTQKGRLISFCGVDGSGKSSLIASVSKELTKKGLSVEVVYANRAHLFYIKNKMFYFGLPIDFVAKRVLKCNDFFEYRKHRLGLPYALALFLDYIPFVLRKIHHSLKKNRLIITDRYIYDILVFRYYDMYYPFIEDAFMKIAPKPDLVFLIDVPPELAFERKKEYTLEHRIKEREIYLEYAHRLGFRVIDNTKPFIDVSQNILNEITTILNFTTVN
ncbi:MAG: dTMP kinase, partial [Thermoplasmata archaeon]